jgi:hypothetical protein
MIMKNKIFFFLCVLLFASRSGAWAQFPVHLGGFTLGEDISAYADQIDLASCRATLFNPYIGEGRILDRPGFKSGFVEYGLCSSPNKILRIKLKFNDSSKKFFNTLLSRYKEKLGSPDEYKGDPFQTIIAWKWSFTNKKNQKISLILQHNTTVEDEKLGNAVKLTLTDQLQKERDCYYKNHPETQLEKPVQSPGKKTLWQLYIPY